MKRRLLKNPIHGFISRILYSVMYLSGESRGEAQFAPHDPRQPAHEVYNEHTVAKLSRNL
jgi:hypothetical protein